MQFTKGGPDVPERLLQAHEDGRVVFFCGAGISYPAGLPGFKGLVDKLYKARNVIPNPVQAAAIKMGRYDTAVGLLEADDVGGRETVRAALVDILKPDLNAPRAIDTHQALLTLSTTRDGRTRLVTTNFDRIFEEILTRAGSSVESFRAPLLPIPKSRWDGLIYLHGLLTKNPSRNDLARLVVSSGDFGLAYLTERWASRFVSALFRNYTVCFVGYSLDDPVLRYMADALSADRLLGESTPEMFAFAVYSRGKQFDREREWESKNVTPILYRAHWRHAYLHRTLHHWSATYRDGARGKERIVVEHAAANPRTSLKHDDLVSRMLWALSDPSGLPAKRFAELDPVPSLDWLEPLSEERFRYQDLQRFGIRPESEVNDNLAFSLIHRPSPYHLAPWMTLANAGGHVGHWDDVMRHLAHWLTRHLDNPVLLLHLANLGGRVHEKLASAIDRRIRHLTDLESEGNTAALTRVRASAPNAIPRASMRVLWRLLLMGRVRSGVPSHDLYAWKERFSRDGLTPTLRWELREMFTPRVALSEAIPWRSGDDGTESPERISDFVDWKVVLSTDMVQPRLADLPDDDRWKDVLPELLQEFNGLLRDVLDLMRELGAADDKTDLSYIYQPSISQHPQNKRFHDWTALIEFVRDAWLATRIKSPDQALSVAKGWFRTPYPLFRRLAFFAATHNETIPYKQALEWLLEDECWWLWSVGTWREASRLLDSIGPRLDDSELSRLERAIAVGPPRKMFQPDLEEERWNAIRDRDIWQRFTGVAASGAKLNRAARNILARLSTKYPTWTPSENERVEFPTWMGESDNRGTTVTTPPDLPALVNYLRDHPEHDPWNKDDWDDRCRNDFEMAASALSILAKQGTYPVGRWHEALQAWSEQRLAQASWCKVASIAVALPDASLLALNRAITWWLREVSGRFEGQETVFFALCDRILALPYGDKDDGDDVVGRAINHPVGQVTDALLNWWYRGSLKDGQGLTEQVLSRFSGLCDTRIQSFQYGRVLLSAHVVSLFRVDPDWTRQFVLPLLDWRRSECEARSAWTGFLWSPQLYGPLVEEVKGGFLDTASHYEDLGRFKGQYASLLTFAALDANDIFSSAELAEATRALPQGGLEKAAETLARAMEGAGDQSTPYWTNRMTLYLRKVWPNARDKRSAAISQSLARVCIAARDAFREALHLLRPWLQPVRHEYRLVEVLHKSDLCEKFPQEVLDLLDRVIPTKASWPSDELRDCLRAVRENEPSLSKDPKFVKFRDYFGQCGKDL